MVRFGGHRKNSNSYGNIPENRQILKRSEIVNEFWKGNLSKEDYVKQLKEVISYTIPYEMAIASGEKYLTNSEISCMQNIITKIDWSYPELKECIEALYDLFENQKQIENCLNMYEFVMGIVSSRFGNRKEYDISDEINSKILSYIITNRRLGAIHTVIYELLWNNVQRKKEQHLIVDGVVIKKQLLKCIYFVR